MNGRINLPPLTKIPQTIKDILMEIGESKSNDAQLKRLENAVKQAIPNPQQLAAEVRNAPKDTKGKPQIEEEKLNLYMLMVILFFATNGKSYREEIGNDIFRSSQIKKQINYSCNNFKVK